MIQTIQELWLVAPYGVLAGLLCSVAFGILGTLVVVNRMVFLAGGVAHSAYGGVGLAVFLGITQPLPVTLMAAAFAIVMALLMAALGRGGDERTDTLVGVLWAVGMAAGILLVDARPGYNVNTMTYLFGSLIAVQPADLYLTAPLTAGVVLLAVAGYRAYQAISYDSEFARLRGLPVKTLQVVLLVLIALCVVFFVRLAGLILVLALLTIGPHIAERFVRKLWQMMLGAVLLNLFFVGFGLLLAYPLNARTGPMIIVFAGAGFLLALVLHVVLRHFGVWPCNARRPAPTPA